MPAAVSLRALQLPPAESGVWALVGRMRRGERMELAEYLTIAESLSFPTSPGILRTVAEALGEAGADHVLVGGLAVGALSGVPRATVDLDVIVPRRDLAAFLEALRSRFPGLAVDEYRGLVRVVSPAIDIIVADANPLNRQALSRELVQPVDLEGAVLRLPVVESAIVLKYAAIVSRSRSEDDARQDITDMGRLLTNHPEVEVETVVRLAKPLRTRSPKEVARVIETLRAGGGVVTNRLGSQVRVICVPP